MIKNIIFDFGGVILIHKSTIIPDILTTIFPDSSEEAIKIWKEYEPSLKIGKKNSENFLQELKNETNTKLSLKELRFKWDELYKEAAKGVNWELLDLVDQLKKSYKVYLFSDTIDIHYEFNKTRNIFQRFDIAFQSFIEGVAKVEGESAFRYILNKINTEPKECVFVDDLEKFVEVASKIGMKGVLFNNNSQLKADLLNLGIKF